MSGLRARGPCWALQEPCRAQGGVGGGVGAGLWATLARGRQCPRAGCLAWKVGVAGRSLCPITWICEVVPTNGPQVPRPSEGSLSP